MSYDISYPNINAPTEAGKLEQVKSYLHQLSEQLNFALNTIETRSSNGSGTASQVGGKTSSTANSDEEKQATFSAIKSLIIKSADIVDAYYEEIEKRLESIYVAQSEFGTYIDQSIQNITTGATGITQEFTSLQQIIDELGNVMENSTKGYIKTGELYKEAETDIPVYGVEVGQTDADGSFRSYARFINKRLSFFDGETEVAYLSNQKLYITHAEITDTLTLGEYKIETNNGLVFRWVGGKEEAN